jgi:hypothetical protein
VSLVIAALVLRRLARPSGAEPTTALGQVPRRYRRGVAMALAVGLPVMAVYALGYAATHPLRLNTDRLGQKRSYEREPGAVVRYLLRLDNGGRAPVTDLALIRVDGSPALQLERGGAAIWLRYTVLGMRHEQRIPLGDRPSVRCR